MNPYDFVRHDPDMRVSREEPNNHAGYHGITGRLEGSVTTLTPLFLQGTRSGSPKRFLTNGRNQPIIPGSSLKGMIRSVVETVGPGCWWLTSSEAKAKLPRDYRPCPQYDRLCVACRMFGLISGETHLEGHVRFDDAVCAEPTRIDPMYTPILDGPKPKHSAWYFAGANQQPTGHKFYFHSQTIRTSSGIRKSGAGKELNQYIAPIGVGSVFTFSTSFDSLDEAGWQALLYSIALEPTMRHKIGYGKPVGLGSIEMSLTRIETIDMQHRYTSSDGGKTIYEGDALRAYCEAQTERYTSDVSSVTLGDLRRIWHWPPHAGVEYGYPTREWFNENPRASVGQSMNAPIQL